MAQFHMSVKQISRSTGRSTTGAAAYRAAERIVDVRTGEIHDYTRKGGVDAAHLSLPGGSTENRAAFWNRLEQHHKRADAVLAREFTLALPHELPAEERQRLAFDYGQELADRYGIAVDVAVHAPDREGDNRNYHAHVLMSACSVAPDGTLGKKAVELDPIHCQRAKVENFAERERPRWAELHNERMSELGQVERIDHRRLVEQGIEREPTRHLGLAAIGYERRTGDVSRRRQDMESETALRLQRAAELGAQERAKQAERSQLVILASTDVSDAIQERDRLLALQSTLGEAQSGWAALRKGVDKDRAAEHEKVLVDRFVREFKAAPPAVKDRFNEKFRGADGKTHIPNVETGLGALRTFREQELKREQERQRAIEVEVVRPRGPSLSGPSR